MSYNNSSNFKWEVPDLRETSHVFTIDKYIEASKTIQDIKLEDIHFIEIGLTNFCNLQCPLCELQFLKEKGKSLKPNYIPLESLTNFLIRLPNLRGVTLCGTTSEPTLHPEFCEIIKMIKTLDSNPYIKLHTNGNIKDPNKIEIIIKYFNERDFIFFPFEHINKIEYNLYRKGSNFDKVLENHYLIKSSNPKINTICQFIPFNYNSNIQKTIKKFAEVHNFTYLDIRPCDDPDEIFMGDYSGDILPEFKTQTLLDERKKEIENLKDHEHQPICKSQSFGSYYLNFKGDIYPCYGWFDTLNKNTFNIIDSDIKDVLKELKLYYYYRKFNKMCTKNGNEVIRKKYEKYLSTQRINLETKEKSIREEIKE